MHECPRSINKPDKTCADTFTSIVQENISQKKLHIIKKQNLIIYLKPLCMENGLTYLILIKMHNYNICISECLSVYSENI